MKKLFLLCFLLTSFIGVQAQDLNLVPIGNDSEELAVRKTIESLFDGMRAGDSTMVRNAFVASPTMYTTYTDKEGNAKMHQGSLDDFCNAVGTAHDDVWDEKIWSYDIQVDDRLASVWTEYTFFLGDKKSHCGVNAFLLFKSEDGWKILNLVDTRRKKDCKG